MNDFDVWNEIKKKTEQKEQRLEAIPQEREVWVAIIGRNIGREQHGELQNFSRPVLVIKKFNNEMFWIIPLTRKQKNLDFYFNFVDVNNKQASGVLAQMKMMSIKRFERKIYTLDRKIFEKMKSVLRSFL